MIAADAQPLSLTLSFVRLLTRWSADDPALRQQCRLLLLDGLAVAVAGAGEPGPTILAELAQRDMPRGPARVLGKCFSTGAVQAARINGAAMHVLDFEPMWNPPNHALSPLLPALLALAQVREGEGLGDQGLDLLRALAKGVEAQGRLRLASGQIEPARLTMHPPGAVGALAAALACADLMGLPEPQRVAAVSMAASRCGSVLANVGSMTKALHCGDGAANGLEAALLAAEGFTANDDALGSPRGWGLSFYGSTFAPQHLIAPLDLPRALSPGPSWKLFPSQFATHFAITAALQARQRAEQAHPGQGIRTIVLRTPVMPYIDRPRPESGLDGKFSWQYTSVIALLDGRVDPASFTSERRFAQDVVAMLEKVTLVGDPGISGRFDQMYVEVTLGLDDGTQVVERCDAPLGSWTRPVAPQHIRDKARGLITAVCNAEVAHHVDQRVMETGNFSISALMALL